MDDSLGAIWDLDGTLVQSERAHYASWQALLREHGRDLTYDEFRPTFGLRNDDVLTNHFGFDAAAQSIAELADRKEQFFLESVARDGVETQPGAADLVRHLDTLGFRQAIASSAPRRNIDVIVASLPFGDIFRAVVSSEQVKQGKPAPDIILKAADEIGVSPAECVVFEDAPAGVHAGQAAGCRVIAIEAAFSREQLSDANLVVRSFEEMLWPRFRWVDFLG
ncbi:MAG TPA: HAD family phosphatase [Chloroflexota bacterium]|jgi:beta-phosphoglucomutase|nr:HAD family phosphatase [Chloroflexota bacterium]